MTFTQQAEGMRVVELTVEHGSCCSIGRLPICSGRPRWATIRLLRRTKAVSCHACRRAFAEMETVLVQGPYLVRTAAISGSTISLTGDSTNASTTLEVFAPKNVNTVTWNGKTLKTSKTAYGSLQGSRSGPSSVKLPPLNGWKWNNSLPERFPDYDDSGAAWIGK